MGGEEGMGKQIHRKQPEERERERGIQSKAREGKEKKKDFVATER